MAHNGRSFATRRLRVMDWHSVAVDLPQVVQTLLSDAVTAPLPEAWRGPYSEARSQAWIRDRDADGITLLAQRRGSEPVIGLLLLHDSVHEEEVRRELRVGYLIAESHWGQGFASELLAGLVEWARMQSYTSIVAGVARQNAPSRRVLEKCGFLPTEDADGPELFYEIHFSRGG